MLLQALTWTLLFLQHRVGGEGLGSPDLYSFFETPLKDDVGSIGPSRWRDLDHIPDNQCGGNGQQNGFGQSPIVLSTDFFWMCHTDFSGYEVNEGNCKWSDLQFEITKHGLTVKTTNCHIGQLIIPQSEKTFEAVEVQLKVGAEHVYDGYSPSFEMQFFHRTDTDEVQAAFAILMEAFPIDYFVPQVDRTTGEHPLLEKMLSAWRTNFWEIEDFCAQNEGGSGTFTIDSVFKAKQKAVLCAKPGSLQNSIDSGSISENTYMPRGQPQGDDLFPNIYTSFVNVTGLTTYDGSLTSPPCTENVYWNIADQIMFISLYQFQNITTLTNCFTESSTCKSASAASEFGFTKRPPQDLNGREVIHRCVYGSNLWYPWEPQKAPKSTKYKKEKTPKPYYSVLYPGFITALGLVVFYILTRYIHSLPYTAVLFLLGTMMGIGVSNSSYYDQLTVSTKMWENINGELLLVTFLPGLLFKDAYCLDFHLFQKSLGQTMLMAFPMVLGGTTLLALVARFVLPYDWSFNFCMAFGAILSATDPVAVSALLNELGAPPRLKMHISGESLLNDGSAIVFYSIFKTLFLYELGIGGEKIGFGKGVVKFLEMSLGAAAVGIAFGLALAASLYVLNRRFNYEESVVQVSATIGVAYLTFYVAEPLLHMSGVLAVVCCGVTTKAFASTLIIDEEMMDKFWVLVEHLLNTILFALGGVVWGAVISNLDEARPEAFDGMDWFYLLVVYILMTIIRFSLFGIFFPIISRIGLKSNWKEMVFQSFGGLRGAVGIALAIALDSEVIHGTVRTDPRRAYTSQLFGITGGISLLTLFINGIAAGPLLRKLGLHRGSKERKEVVTRYDQHLKEYILERMITEIGRKQYAQLDFNIVRLNVHWISNISIADLKTAVRQVKDSTPVQLYNPPHLGLFKTILSEEDFTSLERTSVLKLYEKFRGAVILVTRKRSVINDEETFDLGDDKSLTKLMELRLVFIELLRSGYKKAMNEGIIDVREVTVVFSLNRSVAIAEDEVSNGYPIDDWKTCANGVGKNILLKLNLAAAFIRIHEEAQQYFKFKFCQSSTLSQAEIQVLEESNQQISYASEVFDTTDPSILKRAMSFKLSTVLLAEAGIFIHNYVKRGLLKAEEGEHYFEELDHALSHIKKHQYQGTHEDDYEKHALDEFHSNPH